MKNEYTLMILLAHTVSIYRDYFIYTVSLNEYSVVYTPENLLVMKTFIVEQVKMPPRLKVPMTVFNKLGKSEEHCLRDENYFPKNGILSDLSSNLSCNWLEDINKL